ncbi:TetR/AcrR family transcriptional regulator [Duganella guangzhouensis]|nr:TetR/AcrR family transcriptional regulator [Duganella guangzhouensis]
MAVVEDRRQKRTKAALQGAFRELLLDQGYEALTVGAVAEQANIGRSTFYEHYRTKEELLRASISRPFGVLAGLVDGASGADVLLSLLQHFRENQQVARLLLGWQTRTGFVRRQCRAGANARRQPALNGFIAVAAPTARPCCLPGR